MKQTAHITLATVNAQRKRLGWPLVEQVAAPQIVPLPRPTLNKTEQRFADHLELLKRAGVIDSYQTQVKIELNADLRCTYVIDFLVIIDDQTIYIDTKSSVGHQEDDAIVKHKWAATKYPQFRFIMVCWRNGQWIVLRDYKGGKDVKPKGKETQLCLSSYTSTSGTGDTKHP